MRNRRLKNEINVVPYIDVMLVLLVIFMVATPMMSTGSIDLPTTGQSSQVPEHPLRLLIKANGQLLARDSKGQERALEHSGLETYLRTEKARNPGLSVLLAGDKNVRYESILEVLDRVKQADIQRVGLETLRKQQ